MDATQLDDAALTRQLARLMGWEVVGPEIAADYDKEHVYVDLEGRCYRKTDKGWAEWRPLVDMGDAMGVFRRMNSGQPWGVWERFNTALGGMIPTDPKALCLAALAALPKEGG